MTVIPIFNKLVVPDIDVYFYREYIQTLIGTPERGQEVLLLPMREQQDLKSLTAENFYPIGVLGVVSLISEQGFLMIHTLSRVDVSSITIEDSRNIHVEYTQRDDTDEMNHKVEDQKVTMLKLSIQKLISEYEEMGGISFIGEMDRIGSMCALLSSWINISPEERYALLEEDSAIARNERMEKMIYEFIELVRVTGHAVIAQRQEYQEAYKESALKKQIEFLQNELDEMHPETISDIRQFEMKIEASGMNPIARKEADKVLSRLKQEGRNSTEAALLYDYLDFITGLCWKKEEAKHSDLHQAQEILDQDHFGLKKVKKRIIQQIAVMNLKKEQSGSILLFVGAPGTGKTSIGKSIARALGREYMRVSLGGVHDEADIRGHRRTYIGAMPGRIMDGIQKSGVSNPVIVLDEVDKISASYHGDPASALLEVLDPEQNNSFTDHYMNVPYDLSDVLFICTANTTDTIPQVLLDRMEIIPFEGYTPLEKLSIARQFLLPAAMKATGIQPDQLSLSDEIIQTLISDYTSESGVRGLRKRIETLCRTAAVELAEHPEKVYSIAPEDIREELDMRPVRHNRVPKKQRSGVVTGLAWTQYGGEILYIETRFTPGEGRLLLTGKLGDVMKESAQIAVTLVKSLFPDKEHLFHKNDLHIHVPEGAVPKDGPSAGITMTVAIASLVTGKAVPPRTGMTGEVSLRGTVTAIGGLPEKLMAAQRAGVQTVLIPEENLDDLRDVSEEVRKEIEILPMSRVEQVLHYLGLIKKGDLHKKHKK